MDPLSNRQICIYPLDGRPIEDLYALKCGHHFCKEWIKPHCENQMECKVLPFCPLCKVPIEGNFYSGLISPAAKNPDNENSVRILNENEKLFCPACESGEVILPRLDYERKNETTDEEEKKFLTDQNIVAKCRKEGVEYCKFVKVIRQCAFYCKCTECGYQICTYCKKKYTEGHELYLFRACHPLENERMTNIVCSFLCVPLIVIFEIICAPFSLCYYQCSLCRNDEKSDFNT
ncbi:unnamed protein product [Moneuplotes crassus]|uniref:RING-type domain-containing protein n=1 Tax=Euplotes crassus TaxID=5936 RepID=A0AAD1UQX7_EUPCR|nr:unnamed protein product [Moneuplotes crassus]